MALSCILTVPTVKDMVSEFSSSSLVKYSFPQNNKKIGHVGSFSLVFLFAFCQISHGDPIYAGFVKTHFPSFSDCAELFIFIK